MIDGPLPPDTSLWDMHGWEPVDLDESDDERTIELPTLDGDDKQGAWW